MALVLTRKRDERIIIGGGEIIVEVAGVKGDKVRLKITAPLDTAIHREEVFNAIQRENEEENGKDKPSE